MPVRRRLTAALPSLLSAVAALAAPPGNALDADPVSPPVVVGARRQLVAQLRAGQRRPHRRRAPARRVGRGRAGRAPNYLHTTIDAHGRQGAVSRVLATTWRPAEHPGGPRGRRGRPAPDGLPGHARRQHLQLLHLPGRLLRGLRPTAGRPGCCRARCSRSRRQRRRQHVRPPARRQRPRRLRRHRRVPLARRRHLRGGRADHGQRGVHRPRRGGRLARQHRLGGLGALPERPRQRRLRPPGVADASGRRSGRPASTPTPASRWRWSTGRASGPWRRTC